MAFQNKDGIYTLEVSITPSLNLTTTRCLYCLGIGSILGWLRQIVFNLAGRADFFNRCRSCPVTASAMTVRSRKSGEEFCHYNGGI